MVKDLRDPKAEFKIISGDFEYEYALFAQIECRYQYLLIDVFQSIF